MKKYNILIACVILSQVLFAQTADTLLLNTVLNQLNLKHSEVMLQLVTHKTLPYASDKGVFVIPEYVVNEENEYMELNPHILIAEIPTGRIVQLLSEPKALISDALVLSHITIETGMYTLNKETRAFGVRVEYRGSSQVFPYSRTDLSLYIVENKTIKTVLESYPIAEFRGEWDTSCSGEFQDKDAIIQMDHRKMNGFYNLVIKTKMLKTISYLEKEDCVEKIESSQNILKLGFNGNEYVPIQ